MSGLCLRGHRPLTCLVGYLTPNKIQVYFTYHMQELTASSHHCFKTNYTSYSVAVIFIYKAFSLTNIK